MNGVSPRIMRSSQDCLREAERCERDATSAQDAGLRVVLQDIAVQWRKLAATTDTPILHYVALMDIGATRTTI